MSEEDDCCPDSQEDNEPAASEASEAEADDEDPGTFWNVFVRRHPATRRFRAETTPLTVLITHIPFTVHSCVSTWTAILVGCALQAVRKAPQS